MENFNPEHLPDLNMASESDKEYAVWVYELMNQNYLVTLLETCSYDGKARENLERDIYDNSLTEEEYYDLLRKLQENQIDRITNGFMFSATDVKKKMRKIMKDDNK